MREFTSILLDVRLNRVVAITLVSACVAVGQLMAQSHLARQSQKVTPHRRSAARVPAEQKESTEAGTREATKRLVASITPPCREIAIPTRKSYRLKRVARTGTVDRYRAVVRLAMGFAIPSVGAIVEDDEMSGTIVEIEREVSPDGVAKVDAAASITGFIDRTKGTPNWDADRAKRTGDLVKSTRLVGSFRCDSRGKVLDAEGTSRQGAAVDPLFAHRNDLCFTLQLMAPFLPEKPVRPGDRWEAEVGGPVTGARPTRAVMSMKVLGVVRLEPRSGTNPVSILGLPVGRHLIKVRATATYLYQSEEPPPGAAGPAPAESSAEARYESTGYIDPATGKYVRVTGTVTVQDYLIVAFTLDAEPPPP